MTLLTKFCVLLFLLAMVFSSTVEASRGDAEVSPAARIKLDGAFDCLRSLPQLGKCIDDIRAIFRNRHKWKISLNCCHAIKNIEHECWPEYLNLMGFTAKEIGIIDENCKIN
uniref:Prolamin-like domain-containing protein n=2 Tax=Cucumis melo TaxID=3656 RepID=A0A9I9CC97_CUCME